MFRSKLVKILQIIMAATLTIMLVLNLYTIVARVFFKNNLPKVFGFTQVVVISGSMRPTYEIGDMLILREQKNYHVNDIVTYRWGRTFVTHRIVGIEDGESARFITKGDFNNAPDQSVSQSDIEGRVVLRIPSIGNITLFLRTPIGIFVMVLLIFAIYKFPDMAGRLKRSKN